MVKKKKKQRKKKPGRILAILVIIIIVIPASMLLYAFIFLYFAHLFFLSVNNQPALFMLIKKKFLKWFKISTAERHTLRIVFSESL